MSLSDHLLVAATETFLDSSVNDAELAQENIIPDSETVVANSPPAVVNSPPAVMISPSRRGHTSQVYSTTECEPTTSAQLRNTTVRHTQLVLEQPQTGVESPVSRPISDRLHLRRNRASETTIPSRISPEWVMELERSRTEAENKLANAALVMAESSRVQAETAREQADLTRQLVEIIRRQSDDIKGLLVMMRAANAAGDNNM